MTFTFKQSKREQRIYISNQVIFYMWHSNRNTFVYKLILSSALKTFLVVCSLLLQSLAKKLDNGISVPLVNTQSLHNSSLFIQQLDEWVWTPHVPHFQAGKSVWIISLHEGYNSNTWQIIEIHCAKCALNKCSATLFFSSIWCQIFSSCTT